MFHLTFTTTDYGDRGNPKGETTEIVATLTVAQVCEAGAAGLATVAYNTFLDRWAGVNSVRFADWNLYEVGECFEGYREPCGYCEGCKASRKAA